MGEIEAWVRELMDESGTQPLDNVYAFARAQDEKIAALTAERDALRALLNVALSWMSGYKDERREAEAAWAKASIEAAVLGEPTEAR